MVVIITSRTGIEVLWHCFFEVFHSKASLVSSDRPTDVCRFKGQIMVVVKEG